jgi:hypothetical protein
MVVMVMMMLNIILPEVVEELLLLEVTALIQEALILEVLGVQEHLTQSQDQM